MCCREISSHIIMLGWGGGVGGGELPEEVSDLRLVISLAIRSVVR